MANAPTPTKRKSSGPRVVKDKVAILLYKGNIEAMEFCFDPMEALEKKESDASWNFKKVVVPVKRRAQPKTEPTT